MSETHTQTLESQWGLEPLTVAAEIPTVMLRHRLAREHVGTPDEEIVALVDEAISRAPVAFTAEQRAQTLAAALWIHREQRAEYLAVMSGRI